MADGECIIGVDVGSQSVRSLAFSLRGEKLAEATRPTPQSSPRPGEVDYDPDAIFAAVLATLADLGRALDGRHVHGIAVASVGESCVVIDDGGRALAPTIAWFDRRTLPQMQALAGKLDAEQTFAVTGTTIDPTLTLFKLAWLRDNARDAFRRVDRVLMMADWIAYRLCGEMATDPTLASRTLYFDIHRRAWSGDLLSLAGLSPRQLPRLAASGTALGTMKRRLVEETGLAGAPVVGVGGHDDLCGAFAAGAVVPNILLDSLGTGEAVLLTLKQPLTNPAVRECGYFQGGIGTSEPLAYIFGGILSSGGAIEWLRDVTGHPSREQLAEEALAVSPGSNGVVFLPYLGNCPPPYFDANGRGAFFGLTQNATRGVLYRAVLEGLAMQSRLILDGMTGVLGLPVPGDIRLIGGGTKNALFLSLKANVFGRPVSVVDEPEATALGAAICGGIAGGLWRSFAEALQSISQSVRVVEPDDRLGFYSELRQSTFERLGDALRPIHSIIRAKPGLPLPDAEGRR